MKRIILIIPLFLFSILLVSSCNDKSSDPVDSENEPVKTKKKWTYIFYNDADFKNGYNPTKDFAERMPSHDNLNVIVLEDTYTDIARYYYINENSEKILCEELGELNMGDCATLENLLKYAKENYPAERYILAMYNHGSGALGACIDNNGYDLLSMWEINSAIEKNEGVDLLMFTAPCLMGAFESIYEVRKNVDFYIGSENLSGFMWWFETLPEMNKKIKESPDVSNEDLSKFTIEKLEGLNKVRYPGDVEKYLTMSAVNTKKIDYLTALFNDVTEYYMNNYTSFKKFCDTNYDIMRVYYDYSVDFYDLCEKLEAFESDSNIKSKLKQIMNLIDESVAANCYGSQQNNSHGFSLYFPNKDKYNLSGLYLNGDPLLFNNDTNWDDLLKKYFGLSKRNPHPIGLPHIDF